MINDVKGSFQISWWQLPT